MPSLDPLTAGLQAIKEIALGFREWMAGAPTRKMKRAIDYGERYIRLAGPILKEKMKTKEEKRNLADLENLEEAFFKNN